MADSEEAKHIAESREKMIDQIFSNISSNAGLVVPNLFGIYTAKLQAITGIYKPTRIGEAGWQDNDGYYFEDVYNLQPLFDLLLFLCASKSPVAVNLLHKIATFPVIRVQKVFTDRGYPGDPEELSEAIAARQRAKNELRRRSNPPDNPKAYLDDANFTY